MLDCHHDQEAQEETLDPADWAAMAALGHRMVDDVIAALRSVRERAVWQSVPAHVRRALEEPLPREPQDPAAVYEQFREQIWPYVTGNIHPRFWGFVMGTGTPLGAFAELLAGAMNCNVSGFDDSAVLVEGRVLAWLAEAFGFPAGTSGLLVSGGSMANLVGLAAARQARAGFDVRAQGLAGAPQPLVLYASSETHNSVLKAVELLGLGRRSLRLLPVDAQYRLQLPALREALSADRAAGCRPIAVVANAGTVNTGAIDDLAATAELCRSEGLWLHVDGAFGALAALSPELKPALAGLEQADSLGFDLHKWGYVPYEAGCVLVRDAAAHRTAFASQAAYLAAARGGLAPDGPRAADLGVQLSRGFRALKVWMTLKEHGSARLGRLVRQNVAQAAYLAELVRANTALELCAPVPLNIVCFRYRGELPERQLDAANAELLVRLHEGGLALPTSTRLQGRFVLRAAITNHRSRRSDFDLLVHECLRLGRALEAEARGAAPGWIREE